MKKIVLLITLICLLCCCGCTANAKAIKSDSEFKKIAEFYGYNTTSVKRAFSDSVTLGIYNSSHISFTVYNNGNEAKTKYKELVKKVKNDTTESDKITFSEGANFSRTIVTTDSKYRYVCRVGHTILYSSTDAKDKMQAMKLLVCLEY